MEERNNDIEQRENMPQFVHRDGMLADKDYVEWVADVKYMKQWYSFYSERVEKGQRLIGQIDEKDHCGVVVARHTETSWCSYISVAGSCRSYYCRNRM